MNYLIYLYLFMAGVFITYVSFIWIKYDILPSISASWDKLPKNQKHFFQFYCWGFALPALIIGFTLSEGSPYQFLMFFAGGGILFVGAAPDSFYNKLEKKVHMIGAYIGVITSQLFILLVFPHLWYVPTIFAILSVITLILKKSVNEIWWIEIFAFTSICYVFGVEISKLF